MEHPEVIERLAILNVPHPARMLDGFRTLTQLPRKSWYMFFFRIPAAARAAIGADGYSFLKRSLRAESPASFSESDLERYVEAWSQPGALTAMLNMHTGRRCASHPGARWSG